MTNINDSFAVMQKKDIMLKRLGNARSEIFSLKHFKIAGAVYSYKHFVDSTSVIEVNDTEYFQRLWPTYRNVISVKVR